MSVPVVARGSIDNFLLTFAAVALFQNIHDSPVVTKPGTLIAAEETKAIKGRKGVSSFYLFFIGVSVLFSSRVCSGDGGGDRDVGGGLRM